MRFWMLNTQVNFTHVSLLITEVSLVLDQLVGLGISMLGLLVVGGPRHHVLSAVNGCGPFWDIVSYPAGLHGRLKNLFHLDD